MAAKIYKYPLVGESDFHKVDIPIASKILTAQLKDDVINIWALVNPELATKTYTFYVYGTGWLLQSGAWDMIYINSVQQGGNIWHVFVKEYD